MYARLLVDEMASDISLKAKASSNDLIVPCGLYETLSSETGSERTFVLVFPILRIRSVSLSIFGVDEKGSALGQCSFSINFEKAKWQSRINYRFNKELCKEIRDYDKIGTYSKISMEFWDCISDKNVNILRGLVRMPYRNDSIVQITCTNDSLQEIAISPVFLSDVKVRSDVSERIFFREIQFSIRVPNKIQNLVFRLIDKAHPELDSFEAIEDHAYRKIRDDSNEIMLSAQSDPCYPKWFEEHRVDLGALAKQHETFFDYRPLFSIVVPLYKTPKPFFLDMLNSVVSQSYGRWELILVNASPEDEVLAGLVEEASSNDKRIKSVVLESNGGISENTNAGLAVSSGDFVCYFDHDDLLEPDLLFEYAKALNADESIDLLYCDEDKMLPSGTLAEPFFKPDFNIDLLRDNNYICHLLTIRKSLLDELEPNTAQFDGAQDHNMTLQASERARKIHHVARVLYHWRISESSTAANADNKPYATQAGIKAVQNHLDRLGIRACVRQSRRPFTYSVDYLPPESEPLVSIIIPTKDHSDVLRTCVESVLDRTTYDKYEIVIVENNSTEPKTFAYYEELEKEHGDRIRIEYWPAEFNFSKLINFGVSKARGDLLLLLNNDTEVITPEWMERMVGICSREDVGVVGARLYFRDETIQHAGVCVSGGVAGHLGRNLPKGNWGYFSLSDATQDMSAVTAACMMTKRGVFESVDGFSEELAVAFNDVDYCLKVRDMELLVVYTPEVELFHYESLSRGFESSAEKKIRFHREVSFMNYRWAEYYVKGDPYANPNLSTNEPYNCYYHL